jgi:hypothetical protein
MLWKCAYMLLNVLCVYVAVDLSWGYLSCFLDAAAFRLSSC